MKRMRHSMRFRLGLLVCVPVFCLMLFSLLFFHFTFTGYLQDSAHSSLQALMNQTSETLDYSFSMLESTMTYFFSDETLTQWFSDESIKTADAAGQLISKVQLEDSLKHSLMLNSAWQNNLMESAFFIVDKQCFSFYSQGKLPVFELTKRCFALYDDMQASPTGSIRKTLPVADESLFFLSKRYPDDLTSELSLVLILCVDEDTLYSKYASLFEYPGAVACIVDEEGRLYSGPDKALLGREADETVRALVHAKTFGEISVGDLSYYALAREISGTGLRLCMGVPLSGIGAFARSVTQRYTLIMCIAYGLMLVLIFMVVTRSTHFLKDITQSLARLKHGDFGARMPATAQTTELRELSSTFNDMADRIDHLINEVYEKELAVNKANIRYLQSQINPHFLFNALTTIETKAKLNREESIYRMVHAVSKLLHAGMSVDGEGLITVAEEVECIKGYLYIQQERFGQALQYHIHVADPVLMQALLPRLCLEPIVENAVIHGLEVRPDRGTVTLDIARDGDDVLFTVTDNGVGFAPDFDPLAETDEGERTAIGLRNTHKRLRLIYGPAYGISINRMVIEGAQVQVRIPYQRKGDADVPSHDCGR